MKMKPKFVIWTPGMYDQTSGGNVALFKLANDLKSLGHDAYVLANSYNSRYDVPIGNEIDLSRNDVITIYPEIIVGNPCNAKNVVRWILNTVGVIGGNCNSWGKYDMVYNYCDAFTCNCGNHAIASNLTTIDMQVDFWTQPTGLTRDRDTYIIRKGHRKTHDKHATGSHNIDQFGDNQNLRQWLASSRVFVSYDAATYISVQAAMAGALSIVVPDDENVSAEEWRQKFPQFKYGIAYGFDQKEIGYAMETRQQLINHTRQMEANSIKTVRKFAQDCYRYLNG
jgi:hypothetical protein